MGPRCFLRYQWKQHPFHAPKRATDAFLLGRFLLRSEHFLSVLLGTLIQLNCRD
jgi:branched-subunit amino acid transport protein AzlD